jgi:hypothetical protein
MRRAWLVVAWLLVFLAGADLAPPSYVQAVLAQQEEPSSPRARAPVTFLQINDVYSTVPIDDIGGLARVGTVKQTLAAAGRTPFLVLAATSSHPRSRPACSRARRRRSSSP